MFIESCGLSNDLGQLANAEEKWHQKRVKTFALAFIYFYALQFLARTR
jgi:hypothetical protein